jgi:hypothetical protein
MKNNVMMPFWLCLLFQILCMNSAGVAQTKGAIGGIDDAAYFKPLEITEGMWVQVWLALSFGSDLMAKELGSITAAPIRDDETSNIKILVSYFLTERMLQGTRIEKKSKLLGWVNGIVKTLVEASMHDCPAIKSKFNYDRDVIHRFEYMGPTGQTVKVAELKNGQFHWTEDE